MPPALPSAVCLMSLGFCCIGILAAELSLSSCFSLLLSPHPPVPDCHVSPSPAPRFVFSLCCSVIWCVLSHI